MDFALNEEQQMLQASARRFLADHHPLARARRALPWSDGAQQRLWKEMAAMGWMALLLPEAHGGLELGLTEASLVAEEAGRQLLNLPWASSAVLLALWFKAAPHNAPPVLRDAVQATKAGTRALHCVADTDAWWDHAGQCSDIVVMRGWHDGAAPLQIALVDTAQVAAAPALDPTLRQGAAARMPLQWHTLDVPERQRMHARAAHRLMLAAELVGVGQAALDMASAHAKERVQFGKPIGSYQALKHQLANAWMGVDDARLAVLYATAALDGGLPDARFACAVAEYTAIDGALQSTRTAIQVHGGMGFTWEHDAHLFLKRAQHLAARLGGASRALAQVETLTLA
ncbi:acyl-CoA dehydrogenase family protein [Alicycliphilus denitrificans]|uniref:Acyl-CoA dehydrogenase n=1 Tax=Alicycliphilus denitrificans TaxID=179636 RepID=A0A3R7ISF2_9BURK|nr:acyl-CoA dehydrogenase family protein [Alicycliphilus denitrificans]RKJ95678.1 acyl-CoA dehydrogenase [Alicycliphilus denitrificans]